MTDDNDKDDNQLEPVNDNSMSVDNFESTNLTVYMQDSFSKIRSEIRYSRYVKETIVALNTGEIRGGAICMLWNAVISDLKDKILYRSIDIFNKKMSTSIKEKEDFEEEVNDYKLIEGAYKLGIFNKEERKMMHNCRDIRNMYSAHEGNSEPTILKIESFMEDCVKCVLSLEFPSAIINIDDYVQILESKDYDRNEIVIADTISALPKIYKNELVNRLLSIYINENSPTILISNVEFLTPILKSELKKDIKMEIAERVAKLFNNADKVKIDKGIKFIDMIGGLKYILAKNRQYIIEPLVNDLKTTNDWGLETEIVKKLYPFRSLIIEDCLEDYVWALTHTYIGTIGNSMQYSRTNFYSDGAVSYIPEMFKSFDAAMTELFIETLKESDDLIYLFKNHPIKVGRARDLGEILNEKVSKSFKYKDILEALSIPEKEDDFLNLIGIKKNS